MLKRLSTRLPYIESDGNSFIDIAVKPNATLTTRIIFSFSPSVLPTSAERQYIFGTYAQGSSGVTDRYQFVYGGSGFSVSGSVYNGMCGYGGGTIGVGWGTITPIYSGASYPMVVDVSNTGEFDLKVGGDTNTIYSAPSGASFTGNGGNIYLFACNENGVAGHFSNGVRIHRVEMYERSVNTVEGLRFLIPAVVNGEIGLFDPLGFSGVNNFFGNSGTGNLKIGS